MVKRECPHATASRGLIPATPQQLLAVEVAAAVAQLEALARQSQTITASREALAQVNAARQVLLAAPASAPAPAPASAPAAPLSTDPQAIYLPLGVTDAQRAKIEENLHGKRSGPAGGLMGRFGLAGLPENTWDCGGILLCMRTACIAEAELGNLHQFAGYYGKGSSQKHSDFKATVCQRVCVHHCAFIASS